MKLRTIKTISLLIALTLITGLVVGTLIMHGAASATLLEIKTVDSFPSASAKLQDLQFTILLFSLLLGSLLMVGMYFLYQELLSPAIKLSTQVNGEAPDLASIKKNLKYLQSQHLEAEKKLETLGCQLEELLAEKQRLEKALHSELSQQSSCLQSLGPPLATQDKLTNEISSEVDKAKQIAHESQGMAKRGRDVLKQTIDAMSAISDSSNQIAEITSMIDSIAFETNLLAINASIEAARAGQEGRGFAVVANEVRNLAQRSAGFAKDIKTLIEASSRRVNAGVLMANESGTTLTNIVNASNEVNQIVIQIGDSSSAQATTFHHLQDLLNEIMVIKESAPSLEAKPSPQRHESSRPEIEAA